MENSIKNVGKIDLSKTPDVQKSIDMMQSVNAKTRLYFEPLWMKNARVNLHEVKNYKKIQNIEFDSTKVAFICGAGPSLALHYDLLRKYRDKIIVFAVDAAYPALVAENVIPDFVVNLDASDNIASKFAFKDIPTSVKFIVSTSSSPVFLSCLNPKNTYVYNLDDPTSQVLSTIKLMFSNIGSVFSKYNVGEFTLYLVKRFFGIKNIIFTGIDFAFNDNMYYANSALNCELSQIDELITMFDADLKPVQTTRMFRHFMYAFMKNYMEYYNKDMEALISLNKGILPLKYQEIEAEALLSSWNTK